MRFIFFVTAFISFTLINLCYAKTPSILQERAFVKTYNEIVADIEARGVWPNNGVVNTPTFIFFFESEHTYARSFKPTNHLWILLSGFNPDTYYLDHDVYQLNNIYMAYGLTIDGQSPTFVFQVNDGFTTPDVAEYKIIEAIVQHYAYFVENDPSLSIYKGRSYSFLHNLKQYAYKEMELYLSTHAISLYLRDKNTPINAEDLKNYLAINTMRTLSSDTDSPLFELSQSYQYGLLYYLILQSLAPAEIQNASFFGNQDFIDNHELEDLENETINHRIGNQITDFHFAQGLLNAVILDVLKPSWKQDFVLHNQSPISQLKALFPMSDEEIKQRVNTLESKYRLQDFINKNQAIFDDYWKTSENYSNEFKQSSGTTISLQTAKDEYTVLVPLYDHYYYLTERSWIIKNVTRSINFQDGTILNFNNIPYLVDSFDANETMTRSFKLDNNTKIFIDNKSYSPTKLVKNAQSIHFQTLSIKSPNVELEINNQGDLEIVNQGIVIKHLNNNPCPLTHFCAPLQQAHLHKNFLGNFMQRTVSKKISKLSAMELQVTKLYTHNPKLSRCSSVGRAIDS